MTFCTCHDDRRGSTADCGVLAHRRAAAAAVGRGAADPLAAARAWDEGWKAAVRSSPERLLASGSPSTLLIIDAPTLLDGLGEVARLASAHIQARRAGVGVTAVRSSTEHRTLVAAYPDLEVDAGVTMTRQLWTLPESPAERDERLRRSWS